MRIFRALILFALAGTLPGYAPRDETYELAGTVLREDGQPFLDSRAVIFLQGALKPYFAQTKAGMDGKFKFKNVSADTYTLIVAVPRLGALQKTIEVGPGFADSRKRVVLTVTVDKTAAMEKTQVVSAGELSVPDNAKQEYSKAEECLTRRDIQGAVDHLKRATGIAPQYAAAWNFLGTIAHQTRQFAQAEEYFREALRQDAQMYPALVNLGGTLILLGKTEEALSLNLRAVTANPGDALAHAQLGFCYFYLGKFDDAEIHLKRAKALDAGHFSNPQLYLAEIYMKKGKTAAAISEIEELLRLHPDSPNAPGLRKTLETLRTQVGK